jgi:hypothetical protein
MQKQKLSIRIYTVRNVNIYNQNYNRLIVGESGPYLCLGP